MTYQNVNIRRLTPKHETEAGVAVTMEGATARLSLSITGVADARAVMRLPADAVRLLAVALTDAAKAMEAPSMFPHKASHR